MAERVTSPPDLDASPYKTEELSFIVPYVCQHFELQ